MSGSPDVRGAVSLLGRGHQCELAYYKDFSLHIQNGLVHYSILIVKHTKVDNLLAEPVCIFLRVGSFNAEQNHEAFFDG
jgi:hypothetical protein